jgi:hypothetical protein
MQAVWAERARKLEKDLQTTKDDDERIRIEDRLKGLRNTRLLQFYGARMLYFVRLAGTPEVANIDGVLPRLPALDKPWDAELWFGGWDPDAFQGYVKGYMHVPLVPPADPAKAPVSIASNATRTRPELARL